MSRTPIERDDPVGRAPVLTPAQYSDLFQERCQYVSRGRHSLALHEVTGELTCDNPGCPLQVIHPQWAAVIERQRRPAQHHPTSGSRRRGFLRGRR